MPCLNDPYYYSDGSYGATDEIEVTVNHLPESDYFEYYGLSGPVTLNRLPVFQANWNDPDGRLAKVELFYLQTGVHCNL